MCLDVRRSARGNDQFLAICFFRRSASYTDSDIIWQYRALVLMHISEGVAITLSLCIRWSTHNFVAIIHTERSDPRVLVDFGIMTIDPVTPFTILQGLRHVLISFCGRLPSRLRRRISVASNSPLLTDDEVQTLRREIALHRTGWL